MEERVMSRSFIRSGALVLGLGLASAGVWSATPVAPKTVEAAVSAPATAPGPGRIAGDGYADVVAKVTPAVVTIRVESKARQPTLRAKRIESLYFSVRSSTGLPYPGEPMM